MRAQRGRSSGSSRVPLRKPKAAESSTVPPTLSVDEHKYESARSGVNAPYGMFMLVTLSHARQNFVFFAVGLHEGHRSSFVSCDPGTHVKSNRQERESAHTGRLGGGL